VKRCDQPDCRQPASVFGLEQCRSKRKACQTHTPALIATGVVIVDIKGFTLIESVADIPAYEEKRLIAQRGLEQVATLENRCEADWKVAQGYLQEVEKDNLALIERVFGEMRYRTQERYEQLKKDLKLQKSNFEQLLTDRDFLLSPEEVALLDATSTQPLFGIAVGNCEVPMTELLLAHFQLVPPFKNMSTAELLALAATYAEKGKTDMAERIAVFAETPNSESRTLYSNVVVFNRATVNTQLTQLLQNSSPQQLAHKKAVKRVKAGRKAIYAGNYDRAWKKLIAGRTLLEDWKQESAELCLQLGVVLSYFGRWIEAEAWLKRGLVLELQSHPVSELLLQLRNTLVENYYQEARLDEIITLCEETLSHWSSSPYSSELLRALYYLAHSLYKLSKTDQGFAKVNLWTRKIAAQSPQSQCILQLVLADKLREEERCEEAVQMDQNGLKLAHHLAPRSFITALSRYWLAITYGTLQQKNLQEKHLQLTNELLSLHFPKSLLSAACHRALASVHESKDALELAEHEYLQACKIISVNCPHSLYYAQTLTCLGRLLQSQGRQGEAVAKWVLALLLYSEGSGQKAIEICGVALRQIYS